MNSLQAQQVCVQLGARSVLQDVDIEIRPAQLHGLLGPNGAGKTTLLRALAGLQNLTAGHIHISGQALGDIPANQRAQRLAYLPQGTECHWPLLAREVVALGRLPHRAPWRSVPLHDAERIDAAMRDADVQHLAERPIHSLSGGERSRVLLARTLATGAEILLADEPVAGLDPAHQLQVMSLLRQRAQAGATVVVVLHDLNLAARFCDQLTLLRTGQVIAQGDVNEVLAAEPLQQAYGIRAWYGEVEGERLVVPLGTDSR
jgi:iron complex transport system ATP-binding protein